MVFEIEARGMIEFIFEIWNLTKWIIIPGKGRWHLSSLRFFVHLFLSPPCLSNHFYTFSPTFYFTLHLISTSNSLDSVCDRDFVIESLFWSTLTLTRISELILTLHLQSGEVILWIKIALPTRSHSPFDLIPCIRLR